MSSEEFQLRVMRAIYPKYADQDSSFFSSFMDCDHESDSSDSHHVILNESSEFRYNEYNITRNTTTRRTTTNVNTNNIRKQFTKTERKKQTKFVNLLFKHKESDIFIKVKSDGSPDQRSKLYKQQKKILREIQNRQSIKTCTTTNTTTSGGRQTSQTFMTKTTNTNFTSTNTTSINFEQRKKRKRPRISDGMKRVIGAAQKWRCGNCHQLLLASYEIDHIVPLSQGGSNDTDNLQALCRNCHGEKTYRESIFR